MLTTNSSSDGIYNIWPNPTTGVVNIVGDNILHSDIFDITGRIQGTYYGKIIDLSNLSAGIYFIRVNSAILKLVKQ